MPPLVWNGGSGGGGISTVHTDGVTVQGDGSVATPVALLDAITDGTTLLGAGISANKLRIQPVTYLTFGQIISYIPTDFHFIFAQGFVAPSPLTFAHLTLAIGGFDPSPDVVDFGVYDFAGNLVTSTGAFSLAGAGLLNFAFAGGAVTIPQGLYLLGFTGSGASLAFYGDAVSLSWRYTPFQQAIGSPGHLPSTITAPTVAPTTGAIGFGLW